MEQCRNLMIWKGLLFFYMYCLGAQERNRGLELAAWKKEQWVGALENGYDFLWRVREWQSI